MHHADATVTIADQATHGGKGAALMAGSGLLMLALLALGLGTIVATDEAMIEWAVLALCVGLVLPLGMGRRRNAHGAPEELVDRRTGLYNSKGLWQAADRLLARARDHGRPVTLIVIEFNDLREVHEIYGAAVARKVIAKVVRKLEALAGGRGLVGRTGPAQFSIVLPVRKEDAVRSLHRALGKPARVEFDAGDSEIVLVPELTLDCAEPGVESLQVLWRDCCEELMRVQRSEQRRQHYLQRERERHSRPMGIVRLTGPEVDPLARTEPAPLVIN